MVTLFLTPRFLRRRLKISVVREFSHCGVVNPEKVAAIEKEVQITTL